jgi:signal transduction histidine kinase
VKESRIEIQAAVIKALPEPSLLIMQEGLICAVNSPLLRMFGLPADVLLGRDLRELVADSPEKLNNYLQNCARSRQPVPGKLTFAIPPRETVPNSILPNDAFPENRVTYRCEGAVIEPWSPEASALLLLRLRPRESTVNRFVLLNHTIDELNQEVRDRRQAEARLRILAEVSTTLAASLDYRASLQQMAELVVGHYADWCMVYLVEPAVGITRVATAHVNVAKQELARRLSERSPHFIVPAPFVRVIETGESLFVPHYDEATVLQGVVDAKQIAIIRKIDPKSVIAVPLQARGQKLGALAFVLSDSDRHYTESDLHFAEEVARHTALVVENTYLYQEARAAEAQLRQFNQSLENLVAERTTELERSNDELDQFAYMASHDLKAPLRAINQLAVWLVEDAGDALPSAALVHMDRMHQRIARMEKLLDDMLIYARASKQRYGVEVVDTHALVHNVVELLAPPPGFVITVADSLPMLHTERVPLETVFRNLLNNAIKHHDNVGAGQVWVTAQPKGDGVEFAVRDNGPGIAPHLHDRIFEIFQSLKPRDQVEGSGIGLAVVKKIVERRGGKILVESEVGKGATFYFTWQYASQNR